jgi:hypothetical protein
MKREHTQELAELVKIPHIQRGLEQRVRICELSIGKICDHLNKLDQQADRNEPALRAAQMHVKLD